MIASARRPLAPRAAEPPDESTPWHPPTAPPC